MTSSVPFVSEREVVEAVPLRDLIASLERSLMHESKGSAWNIPKSLVTWGGSSSAHALGAVDVSENLVVFKTWVNTPGGATAVASAFDASSGQSLAVFEAVAFGSLRTAAIAALATELLGAAEADEMSIIGTGRQSLRQVEAVTEVRPLRRVRVWSPTEEHRRAFAATVSARLGVSATAEASLEEAVSHSPIITAITRAREPFLRLEQLADGAHVNAMGALLPTHAELSEDVLPAADLAVVDSLENARRTSREFIDCYGDDWRSVWTLADVVNGRATRPSAPRLTVFKSLGMGLSDLAVARLLLQNLGIQ